MSQHNTNNADGPICNDSGREANADSLEEGIVGRAVAINAPGATNRQDEGWEREKKDDREREEGRTETEKKKSQLRLNKKMSKERGEEEDIWVQARSPGPL